MKKTTIGIAALFMAASMAFAVDVVQFKAGDISVSVLDTDATTPMQTASIKALDAASGAVAAEAVSDELGQAVLSLDAGRYVMNINDLNLAVFDVNAVEGLSLCRVIMPDAALLVGGQEAKDGNRKDGGVAVSSGSAVAGESTLGSWMVPAGIVAGAAILIGGAWAIIDHQQPSKTHDRKEQVLQVPDQPKKHKDTPAPTPKPTPAPAPTPSPVPPSPSPTPTPTPSAI